MKNQKIVTTGAVISFEELADGSKGWVVKEFFDDSYIDGDVCNILTPDGISIPDSYCFSDAFQPIENQRDGSFVFSNCSPDIEIVMAQNEKMPKTVWSILENFNGEKFIYAGYRENAIGYILTKIERISDDILPIKDETFTKKG